MSTSSAEPMTEQVMDGRARQREAYGAKEVALEADVLDLLGKLQNVADEIDRLEARRREATERRDRIVENLDRAQEELGALEEKAHAHDMERRKRELALKSERERMARVKGRLGEVKTSREYQAVLAETSAAKQGITEHEEALQKEEQELEAVQADVAQVRSRIDGIQQDLEAAEQELAAVSADTGDQVEEHKSEEGRILETLPREVVDRYRMIRARRGGLAVVEARDEACTACFMRIPPQMYIEIIRRARVQQCPNCHRILVPPKEEEQA